MSDDGMYAGSPYDDYDDDWDDDQALDLADDLAQHAAYSPVWQETPSGELDPYYSDWEYYSDDYYDDDPNLLAQNTMDGKLPISSSKREDLQPKKGRKRKLQEFGESSEVDLQTRALVDCMKGTVWAQEKPEAIITFKEGEQSKVSLLTNWRDLSVYQGRHAPSRALHGSHRDETWANDMSLADMGLHNQRERRDVSVKPEDEAGDTFRDDQSLGSEVDYAASNEGYELVNESQQYEETVSNPLSVTPPTTEIARESRKRKNSLTDDDEADRRPDSVEVSKDRIKRRRKQTVLPSPPVSNESTILQATNDMHSGIEDIILDALEQTGTESTTDNKKRRLSMNEDRPSPNQDMKSKRSRTQKHASPAAKDEGKQTSASSPPRRSQRLKKDTG